MSTSHQDLESAQRVATEVLRPLAPDTEAQHAFPSVGIQSLIEAGLTGLLVRPGRQDNWATYTKVLRTLAAACPSTALVLEMHNQAAWEATRLPASDYRTEVAGGLSSGRLWGAMAIADSFDNPLKYTRNDDGTYTLSGMKLHVTGIHRADVVVVTISELARGQALDAMILPVARTGVDVSPKQWFGLGMNGQDAAPIRFTRVPVSRQEVIHREYATDPVSSSGQEARPYNPHILGFASVILGTLEGLVEDSIQALQPRARAGSRLPLPAALGRVYALLRAGAQLLEQAAAYQDAGSSEVAAAGVAAKVYVTDVAPTVAADALQSVGTALYLADSETARHFQMLFRDVYGLLLLGPRNITTMSRLGYLVTTG